MYERLSSGRLSGPSVLAESQGRTCGGGPGSELHSPRAQIHGSSSLSYGWVGGHDNSSCFIVFF